MKKEIMELSEIKLVGLATRTSYAEETNPLTAKITTQVQKYLQQRSEVAVGYRKNLGKIYCVYSDYESNYMGKYSYFVGEEVEKYSELPEGFSKLTIPKQIYDKFTNGPGIMPDICIEVWKEIWEMEKLSELTGEREYIADFEVYDERAVDPQNSVLDIYVGIKK